MDAHYQPLYKQAAAMQYKFHDFTHTSGMAVDPQAHVLRNELHQLTNDLAHNRDPKRIEKRMFTIQSQLRRQQTMGIAQPGSVSPLMSKNQTNYMNRNFDTMRSSIRQHPNFK